MNFAQPCCLSKVTFKFEQNHLCLNGRLFLLIIVILLSITTATPVLMDIDLFGLFVIYALFIQVPNSFFY